jgi:hypothetical protein
MTTPEVLTSDQLLEVIAHLEPPNKRWRQKVRLLAIVGRWGDVHELGVRELAERTGWGLELVTHLVGELVAARIVHVWRESVGTRATAYVVNPRIDQWGTDPRGVLVGGGVPWSQPVAAIRLWVFHVEHEEYAEPRQRAATGTRTARRASQRAATDTSAARNVGQRAATDTSTARKPRHARGPRAQARALAAAVAQEVPPGVGSELPSPPPAGAGGDELRDDPGFRAVVAAVKHATKAPFLEGGPREELARLYQAVGGEKILEWLVESPVQGAPRTVTWLVDRQHEPSDDLKERLERRREARAAQDRAYEEAIASGRLASPEPIERRYEDFTGRQLHEEPEDRTEGRQLARAAREALQTTPPGLAGDTMEGATGGAAR